MTTEYTAFLLHPSCRKKGKPIDIFDKNLRELKKRFEEEKFQAVNRIEAKRNRITLNEWFEEWFQTYKIPHIKETSVFPMRNKFYNTFGKYLGDMRIVDITNIDVQNVINKLKREGKATSTMRDCMESAKNNMLIPINSCLEINVP